MNFFVEIDCIIQKLLIAKGRLFKYFCIPELQEGLNVSEVFTIRKQYFGQWIKGTKDKEMVVHD